jgi:RNA polymerase sigma-70 factor (ECF subfamily)
VSIVAAVLYLMFNEGYSATGSSAYTRGPLCDESIRLTRMLLELFEGDPEIMGLLALMLIQHSRRLARIDASGSVVLLEDQDRRLWDKQLIAEGLGLLDEAMKRRCPGSYQLQGAIAATHARAGRPEDTDWAQIDALYRTLERLQPSPVITLNRAVAVSKLEGAEAALSIVEPLGAQLAAYFNFHGLRGALLLQLDRHEEARAAFQRAIGLANTPAEAAHIRMQLDRLQKDYRRGRPGLRSLR